MSENEKKLMPEDYIGQPVNIRQGQPFKPWSRRGYTSIKPLPQLHGKPWDEIALGYVHALRPSQLRVIADGMGAQADAQRWRVTVWLENDAKTISSIDQEVEIGLPDQCAHGAALKDALRHGLDSPQVKWHQHRGTVYHNYLGPEPETYILTNDGVKIPYPK